MSRGDELGAARAWRALVWARWVAPALLIACGARVEPQPGACDPEQQVLRREAALVRTSSAAGHARERSLPSARTAPRSAAESGGRATVYDATRDAFSQPIPGLSGDARARFFVGNSFFNLNWMSAPNSNGERDGLGPLFNTRSCSGCHFKDGRGQPPAAGESAHSMLVRISLPARGPHGEVLPEPRYGDQLQTSALPGLTPEAEVLVDYEERAGRFADGEPYTLRAPKLRLRRLGYGPLPGQLQLSARVAPAVLGLGLLEAVSVEAMLAGEDPEDSDGDGISGRANQVWDMGAQQLAPGRFGWKSEQPSVRQQAAAAFVSDMGITSTLFERENHSAGQSACQSRPSGGSPELSDAVLDAVSSYLRSLGVPARRDLDDQRTLRGEQLFADSGCARCHLPALRTGASNELPQLAAQTIHPYTDLLLHDLGPELSDGRPVFAADGGEWRTAPLWGIGLFPKVNGHAFLLHDGRARGVQEAILWHGGEAEPAKLAFTRLTRAERADLQAFVESL
jgi:CxxC motif-containing protein (DUF1111 family)